jgi:hypothetical protein
MNDNETDRHIRRWDSMQDRIARLEQSETELQDACDKQYKATVRQRERAEKAEAKLAALKARDCIGCKHVSICGLHVFWMAPGSHLKYTDGHAVTCCSEWEARS